MAKRLELEFTDEEKHTLHHERFHHSHPRVQQKMEVLWLKSQGLQHKKIAALAGVDVNTMRSYLQDYAEGDVDRLKTLTFNQPKSALDAHRTTIAAYFRAHPPASTNQAIAAITELTGIRRAPTQVRHFLKKSGVKLQRLYPAVSACLTTRFSPQGLTSFFVLL